MSRVEYYVLFRVLDVYNKKQYCYNVTNYLDNSQSSLYCYSTGDRRETQSCKTQDTQKGIEEQTRQKKS